MMSVGDKEAVYDAGPALWTFPAAATFTQYEEASVQQWDDNIANDAQMISGYEGVTQQEIARFSDRFTYTETRTKPYTVAAMLGLTLGTIVGTQDGALAAYRQKITPGSSLDLPSIGVQALHDGGVQYKYTGVKAESFELSMAQADPYVRCSTVLIGSGSRVIAADAFPASVTENWLRIGAAKLYFKDTGGTPISIPTTPSQTTANLGGSEVDWSSRILAWTFRWLNNIPADFGYRPGGGDVRSGLDATRRAGTVSLRLQLRSEDEATYLAHYTGQSKLALELNLKMARADVVGGVITVGGAMFYGVTLLIPRVQFQPFTRAQTNQLEDLQLEATVFDDKTNPMAVGFVYGTQAAYLV
jgi:hypothetical protein